MSSTVAIVTGARAEFGLLAPVIRAIDEHPDLVAKVVVAGAHLLPPACTRDEVAAQFPIAAEAPMQLPGATGRLADAIAVARGIEAIAGVIERLNPQWLLVLGDRIEAFAAATAGSIAGTPVAHLHAGDRAEGIADEAMRHAISKLAHLHLAASQQSAERLIKMGERPSHVLNVGSPAVDGAFALEPLDDDAFNALGRPTHVVLLHPAGLGPEHDRTQTAAILGAIESAHTLWLHPNFDPGRESIMDTIAEHHHRPRLHTKAHLPHDRFRSLIRRLASDGGVMIGNSSAGLIDASILGCPAVNLGPRQAGRETSPSVVSSEGLTTDAVDAAITEALALDRSTFTHPYGEPPVGPRIADAIASINPRDLELVRKRCAY